ncbi:MAG: glycerol-3-phosphate acyltransferase [Ruminococcaceae bacterium]|nr:glycerol-3-phosphate acyltransferase [Oscillospiraceae bacterium]
MNSLLSLTMGYLIGSVNPSAFISSIRGTDIRKTGTGNLGATNAMLNFGKAAGLLVMLFDMGKAYLAFRLAQALFPTGGLSGLIAGSAAVAGHIFPFYLGFRGGKGLASLGGLILAFDTDTFLLLLGLGVALMIITNISISLQLTSALFFPVCACLLTGDLRVLLISAVPCALVLIKHRSNIAAAIRREDVRVRDFAREHMSSHSRNRDKL